MTCRFIDSVSNYKDLADVIAPWIDPPNSYQAAGGRFGTGAMRVNQSAVVELLIEPALDAWVVGWVSRFVSMSTSNSFFRMIGGGSTPFSLTLDGSNHVVLKNGVGTTLGTTAKVLSASVNYVFQMKVKISDTVGAVVLWIDDVKEIDVSSLDTNVSGTGVIDTFDWRAQGTGSGNSQDISEVYVFDTTGSVNNDIAGSYVIRNRRPSAAGNYAEFTPSASTNQSNVDDVHHDADTTYNSSSTVNHRDSFQMGAIPASTGTVAAIQHRLVARKDDAGVKTLAPFQRQSSTDYVGTGQNLTTAYVHYREIVETNPDTAVAYTVAEMQATSPEFGYKVTA